MTVSVTLWMPIKLVLGPRSANPRRHRIEHGGSSDCPVCRLDPRLDLRDAVLRRSPSGEIIGARETLTMDQAIGLHTRGGRLPFIRRKPQRKHRTGQAGRLHGDGRRSARCEAGRSAGHPL
jgi:hypothetical protein